MRRCGGGGSKSDAPWDSVETHPKSVHMDECGRMGQGGPAVLLTPYCSKKKRMNNKVGERERRGRLIY